MNLADTVIVLDFETTGLSPDQGDRAIEIGAVRVENGTITDRFQQLMNPGRRINRFIEEYTGITNKMLKSAPPCDEVMHRFSEFINGYNLVAHNASFDKRFLDAEFGRISKSYSGDFACSMLVARRLFQQAPNHKLGTLIDYRDINVNGEFHRALFDSEMTAILWMDMIDEICQRCDVEDIPFKLTQQLSKTPKNAVQKLLDRLSSGKYRNR